MEEFMPRFRVGRVAPYAAPVNDWAPYQFYRVVPKGVMLVATALSPGLSAFTVEAVNRSLANWWVCVDHLVRHKANWIELQGVPISALLGRERGLELIHETQKRTGIPTCCHLESVVVAMQHLGIATVALGSRWGKLNDAVVQYLRAGGIQVVGQTTRGQALAEAAAMSEGEGMDLALELGREAIAAAPRADAVFLPGGMWVASHAIVPLELETGKTVFTNLNSSLWTALRKENVVPPIEGWGRLLAS